MAAETNEEIVMSLSVGLVGLPNVGKSTLFNALTQKSVPAENYPFCTIDPSVGIVAVPDERLDALTTFSKSEKTIPAVVEFVDIAGLVEGASQGEGLGNAFLSHIRNVDTILQVVRIFDVKDDTSTEQVHVYGSLDPLRDISVINLELILADMETVKKRLLKIEREVKRGDKNAIQQKEVLKKVLTGLEEEKMVRELDLKQEEQEILRDLHLITSKPIMYALNKKSGGKNLDEIDPQAFQKLIDTIHKSGSSYVLIDAKNEYELSELSDEERREFQLELGQESGLHQLIRKAYDLLGLMTFFTTGEKETRAWTTKKESTAPQAGGVIHSDFEKKFIRAQVIPWNELLELGSFAEARAKGKLRMEGKDYIVQEGDVIEFFVSP